MQTKNEIETFHKKTYSVESLNEMLQEGARNMPESGGPGKPFLKLDQKGHGWSYGPEATEVEEGSLWAINPFSFQTGHICWGVKDGKRAKLGEVMASANKAIQQPHDDYSQFDGKWSEQFGFELCCISGEDEGLEVIYQTNSRGGSKAYAAIYEATLHRPEPQYAFPIVELKYDVYKNKRHGSDVTEPVFYLFDWADLDNDLLSKSKTAKLAPAEHANEKEDEDKPPTRRRRRA